MEFELEELAGLHDVAQLEVTDAPDSHARLGRRVRHALGREGLSTSRLGGDPCCQVDRRAEEVAVALGGRPMVEPCARDREPRQLGAVLKKAGDQRDARFRRGTGEQDGVTDRLGQPVTWRESADGQLGETDGQVRCLCIAVGFGQGGEPGEVDHREGPLGEVVPVNCHAWSSSFAGC